MSDISPIEGSLGVIIRTFKGAVTCMFRRKVRNLHACGAARKDSFWQRNYYDHIIRSDLSRYFIERYIRLNPNLWELDPGNPNGNAISIEDLRKVFGALTDIDEFTVETIINKEIAYRRWNRISL